MNLPDDRLRCIEQAMFQTWPAFETVQYDGWVLRLADGYTKRANSVNPHFSTSLPLSEKISHCEAVYQNAGLATVFRLTPFSQPPSLDGTLAHRGYQKIDPSLVMMREIRMAKRSMPSRVTQVSRDQWFDAFNQLRRLECERQPTHRQIVEASTGEHCYMLLAQQGEPCACGLGVLADDAVCMFDLFTAEAHRRQGYGADVVEEILRWAHSHGAKTALLQVERGNMPARALYGRAGFEIAYPYWYRVKRNP